MISPVQFLPLLSITYPGLQEHWKLPGVLTQICSHGDDAHSLISIWSKINSSLCSYIDTNINNQPKVFSRSVYTIVTYHHKISHHYSAGIQHYKNRYNSLHCYCMNEHKERLHTHWCLYVDNVIRSCCICAYVGTRIIFNIELLHM